jgi:hypothetical protein
MQASFHITERCYKDGFAGYVYIHFSNVVVIAGYISGMVETRNAWYILMYAHFERTGNHKGPVLGEILIRTDRKYVGCIKRPHAIPKIVSSKCVHDKNYRLDMFGAIFFGRCDGRR